jgi:HlyD family secretion protein
MKELFDKKYVSQQEYDKSESAYSQAKSSYEASMSRYDEANASYKKVQRDAERTVIYAPINGIVTKLNVELGEKVVGTNMMAGTEMLIVSDLNVMNAVVDVDENDITMVNIGDDADVQVDAFPDQVFKGKVIEIGHSANLTSLGTQDQVTNFSVKIRLIDHDRKMRPGMSCNADITTKIHPNVKSVPLQSVTVRNFTGVDRNPDLNKSTGHINKESTEATKTTKPPSVVFVNNKGKAKMVSVETGISDKGYIEILKGLAEGDEIISGPFSAVSRTLKDGDPVKVETIKKPNFKK